MLIWIAETTVIAALLALIAWLAGKLPSMHPTVRHALWLVVLIKLVTPPLVAWPTSLRQYLADCGDYVRRGQMASPHVDRVPGDEVAQQQYRTNSTPDRSAPEEHELHKDENRRSVKSPPPLVADGRVSKSSEREFGFDRGAILQIGGRTWLVISVLLGLVQIGRICGFRRHLRSAIPAPDCLIEEAGIIGQRLGVAVPELLTIPELGSPLIWCLGRPRILLPALLVKTLSIERWRTILTHELAHLRRGDHWVRRLELAAGLFWWWNPVYWLVRARLDAEAELACDAWVVRALPKDRFTYAECLLDIGATLSQSRRPVPTLSVTGSGRLFERRLSMILRGDAPCRFTRTGLLGALCLLVLALPSWTAGSTVLALCAPENMPVALRSEPVADDDGKKQILPKDDSEQSDRSDDADDDSADDADDSDDDDDSERPRNDKEKRKADAKAKKSDAAGEMPELDEMLEKLFGQGSDFEKKIEAFTKEIEAKFGSGSDFEKKIEALGKEIEVKFGSGSDFEKKVETFTKEIEAKFGSGSDFEKKIEAFGDEIEAKFGPEFEKKMEAFGKAIEEKFGPEFEAKMEAFAKQIEEKFGPDSDFARKVKKDAEDRAGAKASEPAETAKSSQSNASRKERDLKVRLRDRRIRDLEAQIGKLVKEIEALKSDGSED
jgi:beta-lactamase regulating signal transducer with metallopeptidase domain